LETLQFHCYILKSLKDCWYILNYFETLSMYIETY
jgi:hypothetical protein